MDTYTLNDLTAKEVRRIGESRWTSERLKYISAGLILPLIVAAILTYVIPTEFNKVGRGILIAIPLIAFLAFYWMWVVESTKRGKAFLNKCKERK